MRKLNVVGCDAELIGGVGDFKLEIAHIYRNLKHGIDKIRNADGYRVSGVNCADFNRRIEAGRANYVDINLRNQLRVAQEFLGGCQGISEVYRAIGIDIPQNVGVYKV